MRVMGRIRKRLNALRSKYDASTKVSARQLEREVYSDVCWEVIPIGLFFFSSFLPNTHSINDRLWFV